MPEVSILEKTKKMLGLPAEDISFDADIIANINSAFMSLNQIGVGPLVAFQIEDNSAMWSDFMTENLEMYGGLDSYLYLKTRLGFDPPATSFGIDAMKAQVEELEYRFRVQVMLLTPPVVEPEIPEE